MPTTQKNKHIFASVGTRFPMDRLMCSLDVAIQSQSNILVTAQVGDSRFSSPRIKTNQQTSASEFETAVKNCDIFVSHAGMGHVLLAAKFNKPLIIMPRLASLKEHINDHQTGTAEALEHRPLISVVHNAKELELAILRFLDPLWSNNHSQINEESRIRLIESVKTFIDNDE